MVGGWTAFFALLAFSEPTLGELWHEVRALPLVPEGVVWFVAFPFVLALGICDSAWEAGLRLVLVGARDWEAIRAWAEEAATAFAAQRSSIPSASA
jgi:hypothetical protein